MLAQQLGGCLVGMRLYRPLTLALHRWSLVVLGRPAGMGEEEADALMGSHRESRKLAKQLLATKEELREQTAALNSTATRLKAERRQAASARQERDGGQAAVAARRGCELDLEHRAPEGVEHPTPRSNF